MIRAFVIAMGFAVLTVLSPAVALAKPRVAIVPFEGDSQGAMQDIVIELLEGEVSLVGSRQVTKAIDKLELDPADLSSKRLKKLAKELEAESIIRGDLSEKGSHKLLHVKLFVNGKRIKGFKVEFGSAKSKKFKNALKDKLLERLGLAAGGGGTEEAVVAEEPGAETADLPKKKKKKKKKKGEDAEGGGEEVAGGDDEDPAGGGKTVAAAGEEDDAPEGSIDTSVDVGTPSGRFANRAAVRVDFGPSFSSRSLKFSSRNFEEAPKPYSNPLVPGGRLEAEVYPLAISKPHAFIGGIGIGGEYDKTLSLNVQSTVQAGTKFPVTQSHFAVGPRLRIVFGHKPTSPSVTLAGGYTNRTFKVDRAALMEGNIIDLPDVTYKGYNAGLSVRFPVISKVALYAGGRGIFVTTTGAIQTAAQYGQAKVTGAEGWFGVDVAVAKRIAVKAVGEFTQMGFAFTGTGQMSNNRDGDPATKDVGGAADRFIGAALMIGVMY
jgi:hypothetical protein